MVLATDLIRTVLGGRWLWVAPIAAALAWLIAGAAVPFAMGATERVAHQAIWGVLWLAANALAGAMGIVLLRMADLDLLAIRPVSRAELVAGRSIGIGAALALAVASLGVGGLIASYAHGMAAPPGLVGRLLVLWLECCVVAALGGLLTNVTRGAAAFTAALWVVGHLADPVFRLVSAGELPDLFARAAFSVVPDLDLFDAFEPIAGWTSAGLAGYAAAWIVVFTALNVLAVNQQDLA